MARRVTPAIISTWLRAAISGTTPPYAAWSSIWLCTTEDSTSARPPLSLGVRRTMEAAVSSQLVSSPSTVRGRTPRPVAACAPLL